MRTGFDHANVDRITENLWVGGDLEVFEPDLATIQLDELVRAGLTDIIDCRIEWSDEDLVAAAHPDIGYHWLGVDDAGQQMHDEWFEKGTTTALQRIAAGGIVLAHCHMGINRGPSMAFAILLTLGWEPIEALNLLRSTRPIAHVAYAEDAADWWARKNGAETSAERFAARALIRKWHHANAIDAAPLAHRRVDFEFADLLGHSAL